jgi:hypothetical protein
MITKKTSKVFLDTMNSTLVTNLADYSILLICGLVMMVWTIHWWRTREQRLRALGGRGASVPGLPFGT